MIIVPRQVRILEVSWNPVVSNPPISVRQVRILEVDRIRAPRFQTRSRFAIVYRELIDKMTSPDSNLSIPDVGSNPVSTSDHGS